MMPISGFQVNLSCLNHSGFASVNEVSTDSGIEYGSEEDDCDLYGNDNKGCSAKSDANPDEVYRVCKVIDE